MATFNASTLCDTCCDVGLTSLCQALGPMNFARDCSADPMAPGRSVIVPIATAGATAQTNPTNFEAADGSNVNGISVTVEQVSISFSVSNADYQQGQRLATLARINAEKLAAALWGKVLPLIKNNASTGFPVANVTTKAVASFTPADIADMWSKLLCNPKHLLLDPVAYSKLFYISGGGCCMPLVGGTGPAAFGWQSITPHSLWTGADANTYGFGYCPEAIVMVTAVPVTPLQCQGDITSQNFTLPDLGITVQFNTWCSRSSRTVWASYDVMFGAAVGVPCKGTLLKSA